MKVLGINGSPRKEGNTAAMIRTVFIARNPGEFAQDEEGITTMRNLGRNMAWLLKKING